MATKSKDSIGSSNTSGRREKVALTTSNSKPKPRPTSSSSSTSSSTLKPSSSSSSSDKPIPNYLKHTKSSLHESGPTPSPKPALIRRKSFDNKAPRTQTKPISERLAMPTRSSSFSRVPRVTPNPTPRSLYSKAPKKGSGEAFVKKEAPRATTTVDDQAVKDKEKVKDKEEVQEEVQHNDDHVRHDDDIATVSEELVVVKSDHGDDLHHDGVAVEEEHDHHENKSEDQEIKETISVVGSEDAISVAEESIKEDEKVVTEEINNNDHDGIEGNLGIESDHTNAVKESLEEENGNNGNGIENETERVVDINVVVDDGGGNVEEAEKEEKEEGELEKKSEEEGKKVITESSSSDTKKNGKKEAQLAYNDVIEETASKLREKRKNKVKALVGAFETVIDYETAANNNK